MTTAFLPLLLQVARRLIVGMVLLLGVSLLIFTGTQMLPGDPAQAVLGQTATPEALANLRQEMGLDKPAPERYFKWLSGAVVGDFGKSLSNNEDIADAVGKRLNNTLILASAAAAFSVPIAIFLGLIAVRYRNGVIDKTISGLGLASTALPEFFVAYLLIYFFAVEMQWLTSVSIVYEGMPFGERLLTIVLPVLVLTLTVLAHMMRMTRAAILSVMQSAYIETAQLKGLAPFKIIYRHALPNALAPIINVVMLNLAVLVVGVVVVEVIFVYPGLGQYLVDHVAKRDLPVVQACGLIFATVYIGMNIVADIAGLVANPRLRFPK
jgi:peptide/nickel transport system permease protein